MYSPYSDLYKMLLTPTFIVFRVKINGIEYFGRPDMLNVEHPFIGGKKQYGIFKSFKSMGEYQSGTVSKEINVTSDEIIGIEAIDTINPIPLIDILSACNELPKKYNEGSYNLIKYNIPDTLQKLLVSIKEYSKIHNCTKNYGLYDDIEDVINDCKNADASISGIKLENLIRDSIEKVSIRVCNLIEFSGKQTTDS
jgi:hypothetical protein